jgi:hypothetical protein
LLERGYRQDPPATRAGNHEIDLFLARRARLRTARRGWKQQLFAATCWPWPTNRERAARFPQWRCERVRSGSRSASIGALAPRLPRAARRNRASEAQM